MGQHLLPARTKINNEENDVKKYLHLFFTMLKIGLFTFGGGYAMIALLEHEFVEKKKYLEKQEFLDMVAIAESTPGPIAINAATYIGYKQLGFLGALACTVAICIPSVVIIFAISLFFDAFLSLKLVEYAFRGIQVCVVYLIFSAGLKLLKQMKKTPLSVTVVVTVVLCMIAFSLLAVKFSTILYILICGCIGLVIYLIKQAKHKKEGAT
ncbi:MAG: chromate transporter [Clostridia bacterium]|nr:chromate transporter [Clostridia bacterium]